MRTRTVYGSCNCIDIAQSCDIAYPVRSDPKGDWGVALVMETYLFMAKKNPI